MLVQDVKAEDILVDVSPEFHLDKLKQAVTVNFYFIIAQCKCNLYCQHTNVEIKYLSRVEIKLSHTASGGQSNLQTHQTS